MSIIRREHPRRIIMTPYRFGSPGRTSMTNLVKEPVVPASAVQRVSMNSRLSIPKRTISSRVIKRTVSVGTAAAASTSARLIPISAA